jgi:tetratricopeptide (TPR) repeat protein
VSTGPDTELVVTFKTTAVSLVMPNSEFVVKLEEIAPADTSKIYENLIKGIAHYYYKSPAEEKFGIETDLAIVGIHGTKFSLESYPGETVVKVAEGIVTLKSKATSEEIFVNVGQMATATASGLSPLEPFDVEADANWEKFIPEEQNETASSLAIDPIKANNLSLTAKNPNNRISGPEKNSSLETADAKFWINKGDDLYGQGKYDEAIQAYDKAIKLDPKAEYWIRKADALVASGKYDVAVHAYEKAIELDPNDAMAWLYKGLSLDKLGRRDEAIQAYDKVIELSPELAEIWSKEMGYPI